MCKQLTTALLRVTTEHEQQVGVQLPSLLYPFVSTVPCGKGKIQQIRLHIQGGQTIRFFMLLIYEKWLQAGQGHVLCVYTPPPPPQHSLQGRWTSSHRSINSCGCKIMQLLDMIYRDVACDLQSSAAECNGKRQTGL